MHGIHFLNKNSRLHMAASYTSHLFKELFTRIAQNASKVDQEGCFPRDEFEWLAKGGLLKMMLPGENLDFNQSTTKELLQLLKNVGQASLPVGRVYEGHINALYLIHLFGSVEQQKMWYADVADNKLFGVWNTQDQHGIKMHDMGSGKYQLEGFKTFCSGASNVQRPLITGELISENKKGWQMCIIPTECVKSITEDRSFWQPLGMRASASYRMDFTGVELDEEDLLGTPDSYYQQPYFGGGAIRFAAVQLGGAETMLAETHRFIRGMNRTQDPFQQARLAEMAYLVESGNLWLNQAGLKTDEWLKTPAQTEKILAYANMVRSAIEDICLRTMQLSERSVGSRGLMRPNAMERVHRDLTTYLKQPAPDASLMSIGNYVYNQDSTDGLWN